MCSGRAKCPFTPPTYLYAEVSSSPHYAELLRSQPEWLIKTALHRGQGVRLVSATTLLAAESHGRASGGRGRLTAGDGRRGEGRVGGEAGQGEADDPAALGRWLSDHAQGALLQVTETSTVIPALTASAFTASCTISSFSTASSSTIAVSSPILQPTRSHLTPRQVPITNPLLVNGRKSSLRLYSLITSAEPLRVYLHAEGFALFASHRYDKRSAKTDRLSFLTNAAQNRKKDGSKGGGAGGSVGGSVHGEGGGEGGGGGGGGGDDGSGPGSDAAIARAVGLRLPEQRWTLHEFITFVEARQQSKASTAEQGEASLHAASQHSHAAAPPPRGTLRRALERLVLHTYVAARPKLVSAAKESLGKLGLGGPHEYAGAFELAAFDVMVDETLKPWYSALDSCCLPVELLLLLLLLLLLSVPLRYHCLCCRRPLGAVTPPLHRAFPRLRFSLLHRLLEVNTSPSMQQEESSGAGEHADLPIKQRVLREMLALAGPTTSL